MIFYFLKKTQKPVQKSIGKLVSEFSPNRFFEKLTNSICELAGKNPLKRLDENSNYSDQIIVLALKNIGWSDEKEISLEKCPIELIAKAIEGKKIGQKYQPELFHYSRIKECEANGINWAQCVNHKRIYERIVTFPKSIDETLLYIREIHEIQKRNLKSCTNC